MNMMQSRTEPDAPASKRRMLKIGVPAVMAVCTLAAVPFLIGSGNDSITTSETAPTTTAVEDASSTASAASVDDVFTSADATSETVAAPATTATTAPPTTGAPTTTTPITIPDTLPEQPPAPIAPPPDPRAPEDQVQLGGISIPKLGVDAPLLEGIRLTTLDNGPGHWPGTAMPGEVGNVVVAAHRTSHGGPFRNIDQLVAGDVVNFNTAAGEAEYRVTGTEIVNPDAIWIVDPTDTPTATLFACHPPGSVAQRIVVYLELAA